MANHYNEQMCQNYHRNKSFKIPSNLLDLLPPPQFGALSINIIMTKY